MIQLLVHFLAQKMRCLTRAEFSRSRHCVSETKMCVPTVQNADILENTPCYRIFHDGTINFKLFICEGEHFLMFLHQAIHWKWKTNFRIDLLQLLYLQLLTSFYEQ